MPDYRNSILDYFADPDSPPLRPKDLAQQLRVNKSRLNEFRIALEVLLTEGRLMQAVNGTLKPKIQKDSLLGTIRRTASGAGYFRLKTPSETAIASGVPDEAVYVMPEDLRGALTGDEVSLKILKRQRSGGQLTGRVIEITKRARQQFVGLYQERRKQGVVTIDGALFSAAVGVGDPGAKGARPGDKVVVEMVRFPEGHHAGEAVITKVLGPHGEPGVDTLSIIHEFGLRDEFPEDVLENARRESQAFDDTDLRGRLDLTGATIITIDPIDARDFDDAISLTREENGHWRLGVHIADVAHFVKPGSPLDCEAQLRGTSVYLPDRVIPMLPEILSNSLASLQSGKVRFTKTVYIDFTPDGIPTRAEFANSAINAVQRFAYEDVIPILAGEKSPRGNDPVNDDVLRLLKQMHHLAMILRRRRFEHSALNLDLPEVKLDFDDDGKVAGAHKTVHDESHQIIEEFMLAANIAVAREFHYRDWPFLRRVHATPDERKLRMLSDFLTGMGFQVPPLPGRPQLQTLLGQVRGEPEEYAVNFAVLRSMKQAEYGPQEVGHYALAEEEYCHFTSPIRRYPDLTIHRLFEEVVRDRKKAPPLTASDLVSLGEHCSKTERQAQDAERELIKVKLLAYLKDRIGEELVASITGVERFGLFCQGKELPAEGLVHVRSLPPDQWDYDDRGHTLTGRSSGWKFRLGDEVRVIVNKVDVENRTLDYRLAAKADVGKRTSSDAPQKRSPKPHVVVPRPKKKKRRG